MSDIANMSEQEAKAELARLAAEIAKSDAAYYQHDDPYLTDSEYDELKRLNEQIEAKFPHLIRVWQS